MALPLVAVELGGYINGFKLIPIALISLIWLKLLSWADKDADDARLPREGLNAGFLAVWILALAATIPLPYFASLPIFLVIFGAEVGIYLFLRNKSVGLHDLKQQAALAWKNFGKKKEKQVTATEGMVVLIDANGKAYPPPPVDAPEHQAFETVQSVLQGPIKLGANRIELRPNEGGSVLRYTVDGVTLEGKSFTREVATAGIDLVKQLAGLDVSNRRKPQTGKMKIGTEDKKKHDADVTTAGSTSGELLKFSIDFKKQFNFDVDSLGLLSDQHKQVVNTIADSGGVVILTVPETHGMTNLAYAFLKKHDAFLSHIQSLERDPALDLEGITQNKFTSTTSGDESKQISWMISQEPDVIYIDRIDEPHTAIDLARYSLNGKRVYIGMRAANTFDAVAQWRKLIGDDGLALDSLKLVVAERLVRTLCEACKISYTPDPDALKKMNMSPDRVTKLFQARKEPMRDQKGNEVICPFCHGMAFKGRTGVFELFRIDDDVRQAVASGATENQFKSLFRKQKQRYLQEAALARVEKGDTSVEEVLRVLRGPASGGQSRSSRSSARA
ncbi:MAG: ATPase, T2SS/T4P/T4SS family [Tepidisphaeraceae bacterium]